MRLKGKYVRSPASRPPSRCGPSSGKHPNIRTSRPLAPGLECSDVRLVRQETRERVLELRGPVTVPREIGSLSRMNDDGTNIIVSQQRRDLVFGDWASAAIFVPRRVWIGDKLLHHLLRCYFRAVLGERRPQNRQQLHSDAWLIWSAREVNRRPTCLLGPPRKSGVAATCDGARSIGAAAPGFQLPTMPVTGIAQRKPTRSACKDHPSPASINRFAAPDQTDWVSGREGRPTALAATEYLLLSKRTKQVFETDAGTAWNPSNRPG